MPNLPLAAIVADGPDAERYLQGQLTCDVSALGVGDSTVGAVLAADGKLISVMHVARVADQQFRLVTWTEHRALLLDRLLRFRIRVKVDLEPLAEAFDAAALPSPLWPLDQPLLPASGDPLPSEAFQRHRLRLGAVHLPTDVDPGFLPTGVPGLLAEGVSLTKGCYVGQELVARTTSRQAPPPVALAVASVVDAPPDLALAFGQRAALIHEGEDAGYLAAVEPEAGVAIIAVRRRFRDRDRLAVPDLGLVVHVP